MDIRNSFEIPLPPERAWPLLLDIPVIIRCVPGAELVEQVDERTYRGRISVRLGPVALLFNGTAQFEEIDDAARTARVQARGTDAKGRGGADSTVTLAMTPVPEGSRVDIVADVQLSGMVSQYGRGSGLIQSVATQLVTQFAGALREMLAQEASAPPPAEAVSAPAGGAAGRGDLSADTPQEAHHARPISGFSLLLRALWSWIRGLFRR